MLQARAATLRELAIMCLRDFDLRRGRHHCRMRNDPNEALGRTSEFIGSMPIALWCPFFLVSVPLPGRIERLSRRDQVSDRATTSLNDDVTVAATPPSSSSALNLPFRGGDCQHGPVGVG